MRSVAYESDALCNFADGRPKMRKAEWREGEESECHFRLSRIPGLTRHQHHHHHRSLTPDKTMGGSSSTPTASLAKRSAAVSDTALDTPAFKALRGRRVVLASSSPRRRDILASVVSTPASRSSRSSPSTLSDRPNPNLRLHIGPSPRSSTLHL